jgi:hypothetical protein
MSRHGKAEKNKGQKADEKKKSQQYFLVLPIHLRPFHVLKLETTTTCKVAGPIKKKKEKLVIGSFATILKAHSSNQLAVDKSVKMSGQLSTRKATSKRTSNFFWGGRWGV